MLYHKMTIVVLISAFMFCVIVSAQDAPEENVQNEESQAADTNLEESPDEAIGDRIMEEMNGMKEKFDVALTRIGEEISKDQEEQNEMNLKDKK